MVFAIRKDNDGFMCFIFWVKRTFGQIDSRADGGALFTGLIWAGSTEGQFSKVIITGKWRYRKGIAGKKNDTNIITG